MPKREDNDESTDGVAEAFGQRVALLRSEHAQMTQKDLAALAGMSQPYLAKIESGRDVGLPVMARLAKAMGVSLADLVDGIDLSRVELESRPYRKGAE